jgi:hypothetical protein
VLICVVILLNRVWVNRSRQDRHVDLDLEPQQ